jgi:hypothetical protein
VPRDFDEELFDRSMSTIAVAAGDDLRGFVDGATDRNVTEAEVQEAGRALATIYMKDENPPQEIIDEGIKIAKAKAYEAVWQMTLRKSLTDPGQQVRVLAWIEERTGRPMPLDPDDYGEERAN